MIETTVYVADTVTLSNRTITADGYLEAPGTLARTGVQQYKASELGLHKAPHKMSPNRIVRLYRPDEEVFAEDSINSFDGVPITIGHPVGNRVDASNWRSTSVGDVRGIEKAADGKHIQAKKLIIRDKAAVDHIMNGTEALSNGYIFKLDMTAGKTAAGDVYDGIQRNIRGNHIAIVKAGRGGEHCKIGDRDVTIDPKGRRKMAEGTRVITVDSLPVELDLQGAAIVERLITGDAANKVTLAKKVRIIRPRAADQDAAADEIVEVGCGDAETIQASVDYLRARNDRFKGAVVTGDSIEKMISTRVDTQTKALTLMPKGVFTGKTTPVIQREVVTHFVGADSAMKQTVEAVLAGKAVGDASDDLLNTAFNVIVAAAPKPKDNVTRAGDMRPIASAFTGTPRTGDAAPSTAPKLVGRAAFLANQNHQAAAK